MQPLPKTALAFRNRAAVGAYRMSNGRLGGKTVGLPVLLLTVPGRKTGIPRTTPLLYLEHDDSHFVVGSAFGSRTDPDWVMNVAVAETAEVRIGDHEFGVSVRMLNGLEREHIWRQVVVAALPAITTHEVKSGRTFPICKLTRR